MFDNGLETAHDVALMAATLLAERGTCADPGASIAHTEGEEI